MQIQFQLERVVYTIFSGWLTSDPHDVHTSKCTLCVNILILQASIANVQYEKTVRIHIQILRFGFISFSVTYSGYK